MSKFPAGTRRESVAVLDKICDVLLDSICGTREDHHRAAMFYRIRSDSVNEFCGFTASMFPPPPVFCAECSNWHKFCREFAIRHVFLYNNGAHLKCLCPQQILAASLQGKSCSWSCSWTGDHLLQWISADTSTLGSYPIIHYEKRYCSISKCHLDVALARAWSKQKELKRLYIFHWGQHGKCGFPQTDQGVKVRSGYSRDQFCGRDHVLGENVLVWNKKKIPKTMF